MRSVVVVSRLTGLTTTTDRIVSGTSSIIVSQSGHISFTTAGTERMVINASGNVGIGTTSPGGLFDVFGANAGNNINYYFRNQPGTNTSGTKTSLNLPVFNGTGGLVIEQMASSAGGFNVGNYDAAIHTVQGNAYLHLSAGNVGPATKHFTINPSGNVGIGTTSPGKTLDVSGTAQIVSRTLIGGSGTPSGTLHVSGSLMVAGNDSIACTAATSGLMRRDPTTGRMQVCR